ncbi:MAG: molybdenum cofactor biosynthesis protein MoaE [Pseudomonadota bacterium]
MIDLLEAPFDPAEALGEFNAQIAGAGAVVSFSGHVRPAAASGPVTTLYLQAYSPLTENGIREAVERAKARWPLSAVRVIHRIGEMQPGEAIVFVAAASAHRRAAFEAADFLMDYLKTEAVFWKKETGAQGASWIEPRTEDYKDRARWGA